MNKNTIQLNPVYFWDIDFSKIDLKKHKRIIIERIINFGNLSELNSLLNYYGKKEIINTICKLNYIDNKTLNFYSIYFKIQKKNFKCFTRNQSITKLWN